MSEIDNSSSSSRRKLLVVACVAALVAGVFGYRYWQHAKTHVSTDNSYVASDVIQITPQVSGTVEAIYVKENQNVKKGDLIAKIEDSAYQAAAEQAEANLQAAIAQAEGAGVSVDLAAATGSAQIQQASGGVEQASGGIEVATADLAKSEAGIKGAIASKSSAAANAQTAQAALSNALIGKTRSIEAAKAMRAVVEASKASVRSSEAAIEAASAVADKAAADLKRAETLFAQGVISQQSIDQARAGFRGAKAQLESAKQQRQALAASVEQRQAELSATNEQVGQAEAGVRQAKSQVLAAQQLVAASSASIDAAAAQKIAAQTAVAVARAKRLQAMGQLSQAKTAPIQVNLSKSAKAQALAKISQARAALKSARIQLGYTRIYAPCDGQVSKKSVEVGSLVSPGYPLMALVPADDLWVVANFKETQLDEVREGQSAEVEIDGLPGIDFVGKVDSFSAATGSTFALLPADNATGNFTKVVQRIPVKIVLQKGQKGLERLRPGMSALSTISLR